MDSAAAKRRIKKLREEIAELNVAYFVLNSPKVSEAVRDSIKQELIALERQFPDLVTPDSPTQRVGAPLDGRLPKVPHLTPKQSLLDAFSPTDLQEWEEQMDRALGLPLQKGRKDRAYACELKIDGLNITLHYELRDGEYRYARALTRGNGVQGEDVTHTVRTIEALPLTLRSLGKTANDEMRNAKVAPPFMEISGEVYIPKASLVKANARLPKDEQFANPRNAAAGTIRQLDPNVAAGRDLHLFCYSLEEGAADAFDLHSQSEVLSFLKSLGFPVNPQGKQCHSLHEIERVMDHWRDRRDDLPYDIDGIVVKVDDRRTQRDLGSTAKAPRWARAYKFAASQGTARVLDVTLQVGRTGAITPVAILTPVQLAGTTVTRATLHNFSEIARLDVRLGDTVVVQKAGDIIPEVVEVIGKLRAKGATSIRPPQHCPSCGSNVRLPEGEVVHRCDNPKCSGVRQERIEHVASRRAMNIEGLGQETIAQLIERGLVADPADLFALTETDLLELPLFKDQKTANVLQSIDWARRTPLDRFLFALGIRHVGRETAEILARRLPWKTTKLRVEERKAISAQPSLFGPDRGTKKRATSNVRAVRLSDLLKTLQSLSSEDLQAIEGIGTVVAQSIREWVDDPDHRRLIHEYENGGVVCLIPEGSNVKQIFTRKTFVLTGTLPSLSRDEATRMIKDRGGSVSGSVSKKTDYVLAGAEPGSKYERAQELRVKTIGEEEFRRMLK